MKRYTLLLLLYLIYMVPACRAQVVKFVPPLDLPMLFSGNFGEIRANHFHGGLDFKTGGAVGKEVRALADGHISRIRVTHGSGYVLDVAFDNGYTAIYRHLSAFVGEVARRTEALQYERESWEVEIIPEPDEYPVKAGQVIALSGNTGYSFGPHLHLDLIDTATDEFIDPLPFFADKVKDHTAPRAEGVVLFPQSPLNSPQGGAYVSKTVINPPFVGNEGGSLGNKEGYVATAWGLIGVGIRAHDYMDGAKNRYGVKNVVLEVDGKEVFRSNVARFAYEENRYINSWTHNGYMKSFIEPGNRLRMLHAGNGHRGLINIDEERPYHFVYTLSDALGNTSRFSFTVQGKRMEIPTRNTRKVLYWNKVNYLQEPGLELVIPRGRLYDDVRLNYSVRADSGDIAFTYQLNDSRIPLHDYCTLRIGLRRRPVKDTTKYYVAGVSANGNRYSAGGKYADGFMVARIRELGTYTVGIDTIPPTLTPVNKAAWSRTGTIVFKANDKETGISSYRGTIDGQYALFGKLNAVDGNLVCKLDPNHVERSKKHLLVMTVTDGCGNSTTEQLEFFW